MATRPPRPDHPTPDPLPGTSASAAGSVPRYHSEQLFAGARQIAIVHAGREYSLRLTAANKLILTA